MKTDKVSRQHAEILAKYLIGEMSEPESKAFREEISVLDIKSPHTRQAWNKLFDRLREEKLIPPQISMAKNRFGHNLLKIAAVILILTGISAVLYFNLIRRPAVEMVRINTGEEANSLVKTLADGSVIFIAQRSLFSFPMNFESGSRNVELKGEAFFDIAPDPDKPFIIETDGALIQVLGTAFNVKTQNGDGFELFVDRGKVKVTLKKESSHSELVMAGEKISISENSLVKSKYLANQAIPWYKQRMHFKDETLKNIINVLNRNFNTTFVLADNEIGKHKLTVTFQNETAETMTELICVTLNLKSQTINGSLVLSENKEGATQH